MLIIIEHSIYISVSIIPFQLLFMLVISCNHHILFRLLLGISIFKFMTKHLHDWHITVHKSSISGIQTGPEYPSLPHWLPLTSKNPNDSQETLQEARPVVGLMYILWYRYWALTIEQQGPAAASPCECVHVVASLWCHPPPFNYCCVHVLLVFVLWLVT